MPVDQALATFKDRHTLVYERTYPHDIDMVFEAVSTGEHLDAWMVPECRVERHTGGACKFGWGGSADAPEAESGTVTVFDPPTTVQYTLHDGASYMRFDLSPDGPSATNLRFTLHFLPAPDEHADEWPGGDLPAPGTAWKPGFVAGFHEFLDDMFDFLTGTLDLPAKAKLIAKSEGGPEHDRWVQIYREHIAANCPPE